MSITGAADEWDFTVPEDASEIVAEMRRHGVEPGTRLHVAVVGDAGNSKKRKSVRGVLVGKIPDGELLTAEDFEAVHQANIEAAERRYGQLEL